MFEAIKARNIDVHERSYSKHPLENNQRVATCAVASAHQPLLPKSCGRPIPGCPFAAIVLLGRSRPRSGDSDESVDSVAKTEQKSSKAEESNLESEETHVRKGQGSSFSNNNFPVN